VRLKIPIRDYLCSILPGLANFPINRIAEPPKSVEKPATVSTQNLAQVKPPSGQAISKFRNEVERYTPVLKPQS
jgi:hypothetical protein